MKSGLPLSLASYPGPAQLYVASSMEKRAEPGIFSHAIGKWRKFAELTGCVLRIVQLTTRLILGV